MIRFIFAALAVMLALFMCRMFMATNAHSFNVVTCSIALFFSLSVVAAYMCLTNHWW